MTDINSGSLLEIRVFGALRKHLDRQGLPYLIRREIDPGILSPMDIAEELNLPPLEIEAVFVNGKIRDRHTMLFPGDRIAFLPYGTPGPYRVFLGIINKDPGQQENIRGKGDAGQE